MAFSSGWDFKALLVCFRTLSFLALHPRHDWKALPSTFCYAVNKRRKYLGEWDLVFYVTLVRGDCKIVWRQFGLLISWGLRNLSSWWLSQTAKYQPNSEILLLNALHYQYSPSEVNDHCCQFLISFLNKIELEVLRSVFIKAVMWPQEIRLTSQYIILFCSWVIPWSAKVSPLYHLMSLRGTKDLLTRNVFTGEIFACTATQ